MVGGRTNQLERAATRHLILVRHSVPESDPSVPARAWLLSGEGRVCAERLAERLTVYRPAVVATSVAPKALATAEIVAQPLRVPVEVVAGLHEHERAHTAFMSRDRFEASIARFFAQPKELVLGDETADRARERFTRVVNGVMAQQRAEDILLVTHGTVMALFVAAVAGIDPFPFWRALGMPCFVALSLPDLRLIGHDEPPDTSATP